MTVLAKIGTSKLGLGKGPFLLGRKAKMPADNPPFISMIPDDARIPEAIDLSGWVPDAPATTEKQELLVEGPVADSD